MIINCTPHVVDVYGPNGPTTLGEGERPYLSIPPSGRVARLAEQVMNDGHPSTHKGAEAADVFVVEYGHISDLPDVKANTWYVVSLPLALAAPGRPDLLVPYRQVRNARGTVVGCRGFARPC